MGLFRKTRAEKIQRAVRQLKDEVYDLEKWGFANTPSEQEDQENKIRKIALKIYKLGADPQNFVSVRYKDLMPKFDAETYG